jgi:hypothetical protein
MKRDAHARTTGIKGVCLRRSAVLTRTQQARQQPSAKLFNGVHLLHRQNRFESHHTVRFGIDLQGDFSGGSEDGKNYPA